MEPERAIRKLKIQLPEGYSPDTEGITRAYINGRITPKQYLAYDDMVNPSRPVLDFSMDLLEQLYDSGKDAAKAYGSAFIKSLQQAFR